MPAKAAPAAKPMQPSAAPPHAPRSPPSDSTMSDRPTARPINGETHALKENQTPAPAPPSVNRKKQKRRQKQAARLAAENSPLHNGNVSTDVTDHVAPEDYPYDEPDLDDVETHHSVNGDVYSDEDQDSIDMYHGIPHPSGLGHVHPAVACRKSKKIKGKKGRSSSTIADGSSTPRSTPSVSMSHAFPPPLPPHFGPRAILNSARGRSIWNTSTQEERENIKTFWLELGEEERRQLVKVEKDAVLKKMKEQQRHSCSCTVCGRKRTAIEEELEVLYDAYYEELEQYANNNQASFEKPSPMVPPPRLYHPPLRSPGQHTRTHGQFHPSRGRIHELPEDEEDLEEEYGEEEEDDEPYSDEEEQDDDLEDEETRAARADFFAFGNSLTVKDGILTVADDLLKNDGKHFIDMMEQLAERRMQREEDTQYNIAATHQSFHGGHNHGPLDEEDYDEEDEDYDSQEEEDYEEDEMDAMTEEQRMEEGRRMFQIFAARMFEQRVLTAYREKVAEQRQKKLIEELLEEENLNEQRTAKKAREAQKKKDKKRLQRQAKEEEKARRDAEKAAEEAAAKAAQEKKLEDQKRKKEEQRRRREAERKAQEEERARKEVEKQQRLREERERQAEAERKHREKKEQEKKRREEARKKEQKEREAQEKLKEDKDRRVREEQMQKKTDQQDLQVPKRVSLPAIPQWPSPHVQTTTPVVPKAPTPVKPRQPSRQGSHTSSPRSQSVNGEQSQVSVSPRSMPPSQSSGASSATSRQGFGPLPHYPQSSTPLSPLGSAARSHPPGLFGINGLPPGLSGMGARPPMGPEMSGYPPHSGSLMSPLRGFSAPNGLPIPPGINGVRPMPSGRGFPLDPGHGLPFHSQQPMNNAFSPHQGGLPTVHSRQPSASFERSPLGTQAQPLPISRPSPIKRPSSTALQDQQRDNSRNTTQKDVEDLSAHLGSSALLDDTDAPSFNASSLSQSLPGATAPGALRAPTRASFAAPSYFADPLGGTNQTSFSANPGGLGGNTFGGQLPFGPSPFPGSSTWGTGPGTGWLNNAFGAGSFQRAHTSRPVTIRLLVIQACKQLNALSAKDASGYHDVHIVLNQVNQMRPPNESNISLKEMLDICDTEGNHQNGGGSFSIRDNENGVFVEFEADNSNATSGSRLGSVPGDIGSPIPNSSVPAFGGIGTGSSSVLRHFSSPPAGF